MQKVRMIDCQTLSFSQKLSKDRMERALESFGAGVIQRLLCFTLYLLGVNRSVVGRSLEIPPETVKSIVKALNRNGLSALEDRRRRYSAFLPQAVPSPPPIRLRHEPPYVIVDFGGGGRRLKLSREDPLQLRIVLLSMLNGGLLSKQQVAEAIDLTPARTGALARQFTSEGTASLLDRRKGQQQDYRVTPAVKAELVQQFAVDVMTGRRASGEAIAAQLKERCQITVAARTVRHHLAEMGLSKIRYSLPELVAAVKKTPGTDPQHAGPAAGPDRV
jgi:transposase